MCVPEALQQYHTALQLVVLLRLDWQMVDIGLKHERRRGASAHTLKYLLQPAVLSLLLPIQCRCPPASPLDVARCAVPVRPHACCCSPRQVPLCAVTETAVNSALRRSCWAAHNLEAVLIAACARTMWVPPTSCRIVPSRRLFLARNRSCSGMRT